MEYVIYCRKSTDEGTERQVESIPAQMTECVEWALKEGYSIAKRPRDFSDFESDEEVKKQDRDSNPLNRQIYKKYRQYFIVKEEKTAKKPNARVKWKKLVQLVKQGKVKGIISYHPDRQARNMYDGGDLITLVDEGGVDLKYPKFHFENTATGKMMLGFLFVFSKYYADNQSESITRGNKHHVESGFSLGKYKHGYSSNEEGYHIPDGKNFELMQKAFHMKIYEGKSNEAIGKWLLSQGFTRPRKKGHKEGADWHNFKRVRADPFYYGLFVHGNAESDLRQTNPYYKPMISEDEYYLLAELLKEDAHNQPKDIKEENNLLNPLGVQMISCTDGTFLSHDIPNKKRYIEKLETIKMSNGKATLGDVIQSNQIYYEVKDKKSSYYGLRVTYADIEKELLKLLDKIEISEEQYGYVLGYLQNKFHQEQQAKQEELRKLQARRNIVQGKYDEFITRNLGGIRDLNEEKAYQAEKTKQESLIDSIDIEINNLKSTERNGVAEFEAFTGVFINAASRFKKLSFVRKREFTQMFVSNIKINKNKNIQITILPHAEALFKGKNLNTKKDNPKAVSFGADDETRTRNQLLGRQGL